MDAKQLIEALLGLGLTQLQIEDQTGMHQSTVSKVKRGEMSDVPSKRYLALHALHQRVLAEHQAQTPRSAVQAG